MAAIGPNVFRRPKAYKVVLTATLSLAATLLLGLQVTTQVFAHLLEYNDELGGFGHGIYLPWAYLRWQPWRYPRVADSGTTAELFGTLVVTLAGLIAIRLIRPSPNSEYLHGSARWATRKDIQDCGLLPAKVDPRVAIKLGFWRDAWGRSHELVDQSDLHTAVIAPTRSGKGVTIVLPTLLSNTDSALVVDLKGELFELTSGWRERHARNRIVAFEPASQDSARWNPLEEIRLGTQYETGDVQGIALLLVDAKGEGVDTDHWLGTAWGLLVGVILHALYLSASGSGAKVASLAQVARLLSDPTRPIDALWREMLEFKHTAEGPHPIVGQVARAQQNRPPEEGGSVISTAARALSLWLDPVVSRNTEHCDFRLSDLMRGPQAMTLYLVATPADKDRVKVVIRILLSMVLRYYAGKLEFEAGRPRPSYKHRLLVLADEAAALGRVPLFEESIAYVAGYGIRYLIIFQNFEQLEAIYGQHQVLTGNCHRIYVFPPTPAEKTAERISGMLGDTTVAHTSVTRSGWGLFRTPSSTVQHTQRRLLTAQEVATLPGPVKKDGKLIRGGTGILFCVGFNPILCERVKPYFQCPVYAERSRLTPAARVQDPAG